MSLATRANPAVSVVLPVYNAKRYLGEAVDSILGQTLRDFELILIDDGSTDGSTDLLNRYAGRDRRVRLRSRPNTGIVGALNEGLSLCRAPLVARMDADDVALPDRLESQARHMAEHPDCVLVGSRVTLIDPQGLPIRPWVDALDHEQIDAAHLARQWPVVHPTVMMRTAAVRQVGGYRQEFAWLEDVDLFLRLAEVGRLANLPESLLKYRQHFGSICHTRVVAQAALRDRLLADTFRRRGLEPAAAADAGSPKVPAEYHRLWGWWALQAGNRPTARKHAAHALWRRPLRPNSWRLALCALRGY